MRTPLGRNIEDRTPLWWLDYHADNVVAHLVRAGGTVNTPGIRTMTGLHAAKDLRALENHLHKMGLVDRLDNGTVWCLTPLGKLIGDLGLRLEALEDVDG